MNNELIEMKQELLIQQQKSEILELKCKLQKTQIEKSSRLDDSLFSPNLYDHYQKVSVMLSQSSIVPNAYRKKPEDIFVAMAMGYQLGFPIEQSLQDIALINGRPCLWGDGLLSLALNHPDCQSIDEEPIFDSDNNLFGYRCTVTRKGHKPHVKHFTLQDAKSAGLLSRSPVWKTYPERMLQMRARSFAIRDKFADALRGLRIAEIEEEDSKIFDVESKEVYGETQVDKLKSIIRGKKDVEQCNDGSYIHEFVTSECDVLQPKDLIRTSEGFSEKLGGEVNNGECEIRISSEQLKKINEIIEYKGFDQEKISKTLKWCKVTSFDELTEEKAKFLLSKLEEIK